MHLAENAREERGLAGADGADDGSEGAAFDLDVEVFERWGGILIVPREVTGLDFDGDVAAADMLDSGVVELGAGHVGVEAFQGDHGLGGRDESLREVPHWLLKDLEEGGGREDEAGVEANPDGDAGGEDEGGDDDWSAPEDDDVAGNRVHELGKPAELALPELSDPAIEVIFPSLELDDAHVVEHLVSGFHALIAHAHKEELEAVVPASTKGDEDDDTGDGADGSGDGGAKVQVEEGEGDADLQRHEPDVMQLEHHVGELLRVHGHVVDDHADAVGLPGGAGETETLAVEVGDESGADHHTELRALEVVLMGAQDLEELGGEEDPAEVVAFQDRAALSAGEVDETLD